MIKLVEKMDTKTTYCETLLELGKKNKNIVVVEADLMGASGTREFKESYPGRLFNVGISEQDMIGFSAGLAAMGKIPFAATFACFLSQRGCDQAVNSVAYNNFNVKMVGTYAGLAGEKNGGTHISILDIAIFRSMPRLQVFDPGDAVEFKRILEYAAMNKGPMYIRSNKGSYPVFHNEQFKFVPGVGEVLNEGEKVGIITTGICTLEGIKACMELRKEDINVHHVHLSSIKPIDRKLIVETAKKVSHIITVENHSINGGLGSAVAEVLSEEGLNKKLVRMGLKDCFGETATLDYMLKKFEIDNQSISKKVKEIY